MSVFSAEFCPCCMGPLVVRAAQDLSCINCRLSSSVSLRLWLGLDDICPINFNHEAVSRLEYLGDQNHFWIRGRYQLVKSLLKRLHGAPTRQWDAALELGCGAGLMLPLLEEHAKCVVAMDGHRSLLLRAFDASNRTIVLQGDLTNTKLNGREFDLITAFDVLEHLDADAFLSEARRLARNDAKLLISVPAFNFLWSDMDARAGHRCRYNWAQLKVDLLRNGWHPMGHTYYQFLLFPLVYFSRRIDLVTSTRYERRPPSGLDWVFGTINHLEVALLNGFTLPFGSSLFAWASLKK